MSLIEPDTVSAILALVVQPFKNANPKQFPSSQPVALERENLFKLKRFQYAVCEKTDGNRTLLVTFCGRLYSVDRGMRVSLVNDVTSTINNSVLDGEHLPHQNKYIIHDCLMFDNEPVTHIPNLYSRLEFAERVINTLSDKSTITLKQFYETKDILKPDFETILSLSGNERDGLIFTPVNWPVHTGRDNSLFKWKPNDKNTFDFVVFRAPKVFVFYIYANKKLKRVYDLAMESKNGEEFENFCVDKNLQYIEESTEWMPISPQNVIIEVSYSPADKTYHPERVRTDKTHPNGYITFMKTHLNIKENITMNDIKKKLK